MTEYFAFMEVRYRRSSPLPGRGRNRQVTKAYPHRYIQLTKSKSWTGFEVSLNILYLPVFHFPLSGAPLFSLLCVHCRSTFHNTFFLLRL